MSHPRSLPNDQAIALEQWYSDFERVGTVAAKCGELGISPHTLYDTVRRIRGQDTRTTREKLSAAEIDQLADQLLAANNHCEALHVEPSRTVEEQSANADSV